MELIITRIPVTKDFFTGCVVVRNFTKQIRDAVVVGFE